MSLVRRNYKVLSFSGEVIEGYDGHIYLLSRIGNDLYELRDHKIVHMFQLFDSKLDFMKSGYGYVVAHKRGTR